EIYQHPQAVRASLEGRVVEKALRDVVDSTLDLSSVTRVQCLACGTSYYACMVAKYLIEEHCGVPVDVDLASEFRYRPATLSANTLSVAVSQSGETIDTLFALKYAKEQGSMTLALVNAEGSSIEHEADATFPLKAGVEVGVASTKAFSAQMSALLLVGLQIAKAQGKSAPEVRDELLHNMLRLPQTIETILEQLDGAMSDIADELKDTPGYLFMGRGAEWPVAQEGALKLRELAYVFAEAYAGGELKHGSIALVDKDSWIVAVAPRDKHFEKMMSNIAEIKARGGNVLAIGTEGDSELESISDHFVGVPNVSEPLIPFLTCIPLHLFAYWVARHKGNDVDQPRNLAKSVTVE
ncbi:MAG: isomerizing glutamine--fructose-6-phosphate transaminase, partial [Bdellovibrionales bacterium]|nr:isomerizing glutamine--fructose-6-phosphate transaminase [Bdellovibrionales bacterium]